jgi:hypothetical protein
MISLVNIAWSAGFIEGEGTFTFYEKGNFPYITVGQKDIDLLQKLKNTYKGNIYHRERSGINQTPIEIWQIGTNNAIAIMMTIFPFMSKKRKNEIIQVINKWKGTRIVAQNSKFRTHCKNGHPWVPENIRVSKYQNYCLPCNKEWWKLYLERRKQKPK